MSLALTGLRIHSVFAAEMEGAMHGSMGRLTRATAGKRIRQRKCSVMMRICLAWRLKGNPANSKV